MDDIKCAVIGNPVKHSLSPLIHNTLYKKYGIPGKYTYIELEQDEIASFCKEAKSELCGFNVTMPFKNAIREFLDEDHGKLSVNTVLNKNGVLRGYSTDEFGFHRSLSTKDTLCSFDSIKVVIIGAGSVAKSLALYIRDNNGDVTIQNRTFIKAESVAKELNIKCAELFDNRSIKECDLLINATPLGMIGQKEFDDYSFLNSINKDALVYDLNYSIDKTGLEEQAECRGLRSMNGLKMLIWQAFKAFEYFTGISPSSADEESIMNVINEKR